MKYCYGNIVEKLLCWYDENRRSLRWREDPKPYYVWVSEIMLQQTRVEVVKRYFDSFIESLPTVETLADVQEERLLKLWEGLGYYNRVKNMQKAAAVIMNEYGGKLPDEYETLLTLPGIGPYTAGAIASIAYQKKIAAVDGNVLRVMKRLAGSYDDISKQSIKNELQIELNAILPDRPGDFNQAVMDLGASICIPNGKPLCHTCPLQQECIAFQKGIVMELPVKAKKKERKVEEKTVLLLQKDGRFALNKRTGKGLLEGLWEFPNVSGNIRKTQLLELCKEYGFQVIQLKKLPNAKHIFSHVEWRMTGYYIRIAAGEIKKEIREELLSIDKLVWADVDQINNKYALAGAFQTYKDMLIR